MKKIVANLLAVAGGAITSLIGILLLGVLLNSDSLSLADPGQSSVTPLLILTGLLLVGIVALWSGLRMMRPSVR